MVLCIYIILNEIFGLWWFIGFELVKGGKMRYDIDFFCLMEEVLKY